MKYSKQEILQYVSEEDVKFIRLAFFFLFGKQKNISIMPEELPHAFEDGIAIDASAIAGFGDETHSDLLLHPDADTLMPLPWRPEHGRVVRLFCNISYPDGRAFECDTRSILKKAIQVADKAGIHFYFGAEQEFYLFTVSETGEATKNPYDNAGYMDIAPDDRGENIRREICLTLEQMGIYPERSHHEQGPGQNEIDFRYSDPLTAADNAMTFHINISAKADDNSDYLHQIIAGILAKVCDMTLFLNPLNCSYQRFGNDKAPQYISWSSENRSQLIRIPAAVGKYRRAELRSPDPTANSYLAFALMIYAGLYGIQNHLQLAEPTDINLYKANADVLSKFKMLPSSLRDACESALNSDFIKQHIPNEILEIYCHR